jgi:hypothetical protein
MFKFAVQYVLVSAVLFCIVSISIEAGVEIQKRHEALEMSADISQMPCPVLNASGDLIGLHPCH